MKNVLAPLPKSVLVPLKLTAAASATDAAIQKKIFCQEQHGIMNDIVKIFKSLEDSGLLTKGIIKTIKNEAKEQKDGFLGMFLGTLGANLLRNMLGRKDPLRAGEEKIRSGPFFSVSSSFN